MHLEKQLTDMAIAYGWDYCGFADLTRFHTYMRSFCGPFINQFPPGNFPGHTSFECSC
jgi:hypothetical protein